uniref:Uncharacterized protein n=1 Tax=Caenorhabditis tropicalis TaxID=1561998 RepID=A0A1I7UC13_9PELO
MGALKKISNALDTKQIGDVLLALQSLDDDVDLSECEASFAAFLHEIVTWDLTESTNIAENVIRQMMSFLKTPEQIQMICEKILKAQTAGAVEIAVEVMRVENLKLSHEDCREVWKSIEATKKKVLKDQQIEEYLRRTAANSAILRVSGTPEKFISKLLDNSLKDANHCKIPKEFLNKLVVISPFHPLMLIEDARNPLFWLPRVTSEEYRFRQEVDAFIKYSDYQKNNSRSLLQVFRTICERMERIELMESEVIERIVDFWMTGIGILEGSAIGMEDIQEAAKWLERTAQRFVENRQPLFLKRFLRKLAEKKDSTFSMEPQLVATIITTFQRITFRLKTPEAYAELGEFWTLCFKMKYDDVYLSTVFYTAVFALAQAQAVFRVNKELCRAVYKQILQPMHQQIVDFVKLKEVEKSRAMSDEERLILEEKNFGSSYFSILTCTYKMAEERILEFINN